MSHPLVPSKFSLFQAGAMSSLVHAGSIENRFAVVDTWQHGCWHSMNASCGPPLGSTNWPSAPELARLPNVLPLPGMAMRDKDWWTATITEVAANLDALVHQTPYNHLVRNASTASSVRPLLLNMRVVGHVNQCGRVLKKMQLHRSARLL